VSEYLRGLIASHEDEIEEAFDAYQRAADCASAKEEARAQSEGWPVSINKDAPVIHCYGHSPDNPGGNAK